MGNRNQFEWVRRHRNLIAGPVLEIGSRHYKPGSGSSIDYRSLCNGCEYLGVDLSDGANVDLVLDLTEDFARVDAALDGKRFKTVICCSVLEHVRNVFAMAQNISRLVSPDAAMFLSVPFTWRFHGYPSDYWRFTPEAIKFLFPEFDFQESMSTIASNMRGHESPLDNPNAFAVIAPFTPPRMSLLKWAIKGLAKDVRGQLGYNHLLLPTNINMVGIRR